MLFNLLLVAGTVRISQTGDGDEGSATHHEENEKSSIRQTTTKVRLF